MTHPIIHILQRVHIDVIASSRLDVNLVVALHRCNQVEEQRIKSTATTFLEQDLEPCTYKNIATFQITTP